MSRQLLSPAAPTPSTPSRSWPLASFSGRIRWQPFDPSCQKRIPPSRYVSPAAPPAPPAAPSANFVTMWSCLARPGPAWLSNYLISVFVCQLMFTNLLTPPAYQCVCSAVNNIRNRDENPQSARRTPWLAWLASPGQPHLHSCSSPTLHSLHSLRS